MNKQYTLKSIKIFCARRISSKRVTRSGINLFRKYTSPIIGRFWLKGPGSPDPPQFEMLPHLAKN